MNFEVGKEYKTANGSRVRYDGLTVTGEGLFFYVIEGGHGIAARWGAQAGEPYTVLKNGLLLAEANPDKTFSSELAGMRIIGEWSEGSLSSTRAFDSKEEQQFCERLGKAIAEKLLELLKGTT